MPGGISALAPHVDICARFGDVVPWLFDASHGQLRAAETLLLAEYEQCSDKTDIYPLILLQTLGFIYLLTGQLEQAMQIGQALIQGATHSGIMFTKNWGDYYLGVA